ncbi:MAG: sigma-70 family RNA polymerase sigma factor [Planctomycetota bacterium]|nr:sigma-70 family RNA polymerase sigma factor [Planctomycetota bacterium]
MDETTVARLARRAKGGDGKAFAELYRAFAPRVFGLCRRMLGTPDRAEDAMSEVFLRVRKAMNGYDESLPFSRWVLSVAGHLCVDRLRRRGVERRIFPEEEVELRKAAAPGPTPLRELADREERETLKDAVKSLPEKYRMPVVLRYYGDLTYNEIGEALALPRSHVATLLFRARQELRRALRGKIEGGES